jgi:hypothetical protein
MGLAYTIDSPIRVAHFGISSVISITDDELTEKMRAYYCAKKTICHIQKSAKKTSTIAPNASVNISIW